MAEIHKLPSHMADLIAAGEVVERPMSVVKELLENAIDANSKSITIEIEHGGISYIRITDDGKGMTKEDAEICFLRHATSKIFDENDLFSIKTLGFRGEALAAVSAVSKIDLFTKQSQDLEGTLVKIEGSETIEVSKTGARDGTTIVVRDLFYNTPARMKFLKKDYTEASYITGMIENIALSHPEIAFKYIKDGKNILKTNGNGNLKTAIYNVLGKEVSDQVIELDFCEIDGVSIDGFISKPNFSKPTRNLQYLFVNGRFIKSRMISAALDEAYKNSVMNGKFPMCIINIKIDPRKVDVNVHPTKTEVKFESDKKIFDIVSMSCKHSLQKSNFLINAQNIRIKEQETVFSKEEIVAESISFDTLQKSTPKPTETQTNHAFYSNFTSVQASPSRRFIDVSVECDDFDDVILSKVEKHEQLQPEIQAVPVCELVLESPMIVDDKTNASQNVGVIETQEIEHIQEKVFEKPIKFIGECFNTYILCEYDGDFMMIDKHAAHERINFNKLKNQNTQSMSQVLLTPIIVSIPREEYGDFVENLEQINKLGFLIEDFSNGNVVVREIPSVLANETVEDTVLEISAKLINCKSLDLPKIDDILHMIACKSAIKGNKFTDDYELEELAKKVILDSEVSFCPHGRPVKVAITKNEIEKMFKRVL